MFYIGKNSYSDLFHFSSAINFKYLEFPLEHNGVDKSGLNSQKHWIVLSSMC